MPFSVKEQLHGDKEAADLSLNREVLLGFNCGRMLNVAQRLADATWTKTA